MSILYPLKFKPVFKEMVWGGSRLGQLGKDITGLVNCGESWEIGAFQSLDSVVVNGFLKENTLSELVEVYMSDLVGESVFDKFGNLFPLLVKFVDTNDRLSLQVHPDDETAMDRHGRSGKTEAWYIVNASAEAVISLGFKKQINTQELVDYIKNNTLEEVLQTSSTKEGDFFYVPAGTIHAIGKGVTLCEIQQASDVTYRLHDYNRPGLDGKPRDLHIAQALDVIDYGKASCFDKKYDRNAKGRVEMVAGINFNINLLSIDQRFETDYFHLDSFVILVCTQGEVVIDYKHGSETISAGDVVLLPAEMKQLVFECKKPSKILEVYVPAT